MVANHLPLRAVGEPSGGHRFEWDEDSLIGQAKVLTFVYAVPLLAFRFKSPVSVFSYFSMHSSLSEHDVLGVPNPEGTVWHFRAIVMVWGAGGYRPVDGSHFCRLSASGCSSRVPRGAVQPFYRKIPVFESIALLLIDSHIVR